MSGDSQATVVQSCAICGARFQVYASVREALCPTCGATNQIGARPVPAARPVQARMPAARPQARPQVRPIVVVQESSAQGWLVLLMLAIMVGGGISAFIFRDRIWPKAEKPLKAPEEVVTMPPVDFDREYRLARMKLLDGDKETALQAAKSFRELDGPAIAQPMRNWVTFHAGLANLIAGNADGAEERFRKLGERASSKEASDPKLAAFFARSAELGSTSDAVPVSAGEGLNRKNYEAMGLLLYGLKNWSLGKIEEATALLSEFTKATPEGEDEWVDEYKPLAGGLVSDREQWLTASKAYADSKGSPDKLTAALDTVRSARRQLQSKQFTAEVTKMETELADAVAAHEAAQAKMLAEREAAEATGIVELKTKTDALAKEFRFAEALAAAQQGKFTTEKRQAEHKLIQKRMGSLVRFQRNLAADLALMGYREGVMRADGKVVPGDVRTANEATIGTVPWKEVSVDWLTKVASGFIAATPRLDYKSDRQFDLGIFLLLNGKTKEADAWITKAGDIKYEYVDAAMALFELPPEKTKK